MDAKVTRGGNALTVEFENCGCKYVVVKMPGMVALMLPIIRPSDSGEQLEHSDYIADMLTREKADIKVTGLVSLNRTALLTTEPELEYCEPCGSYHAEGAPDCLRTRSQIETDWAVHVNGAPTWPDGTSFPEVINRG